MQGDAKVARQDKLIESVIDSGSCELETAHLICLLEIWGKRFLVPLVLSTINYTECFTPRGTLGKDEEFAEKST